MAGAAAAPADTRIVIGAVAKAGAETAATVRTRAAADTKVAAALGSAGVERATGRMRRLLLLLRRRSAAPSMKGAGAEEAMGKVLRAAVAGATAIGSGTGTTIGMSNRSPKTLKIGY